MSPDLSSLPDAYFVRGRDPDFATGRRANLVYAVPSRTLCYSGINPHGPDPLTYLQYARRDLASGTQQGAINAIGHSKRAVHLAIDKLLETYSLGRWIRRRFPAKAEILAEMGALPTRMVSALNRTRNMVEHEYRSVQPEEVADFVELTELVLQVVYPFFQEATIGVCVGTAGSNECEEWYVAPGSGQLAILRPVVGWSDDLAIGRIHCDIVPVDGPPRMTIPLSAARQAEWMPFVDVLVYCTRQRTLRLPPGDADGPSEHVTVSTHHILRGFRIGKGT